MKLRAEAQAACPSSVSSSSPLLYHCCSNISRRKKQTSVLSCPCRKGYQMRCPHTAFGNASIIVQMFLPQAGTLVSLCLVRCDSLHLLVCLSTLGAVFYCFLTSLMIPRRAADFSICSDFYLFLGRNSKFQAPHMWNGNQKSLLLSSAVNLKLF